MAYSTKEQVREVIQGHIEEGGEFDVTPSKLSDDQIEYEIKNADAQIDLVLRKRGYSTPLPGGYDLASGEALPDQEFDLPGVINSISIDIAAAQCDLIFRGSRDYQGAGDANPFRIRYDRARKLLLQIGDGNYPVYNPGEGPEYKSPYSAVVFNPYPGDVLLTEEVFPRGARFLHDNGTEFATRPYSGRGEDYYGRGR